MLKLNITIICVLCFNTNDTIELIPSD
ncbi:hypothetical protein VCHENC02_2328, partial [Vibrio harveyi]